MKAPTGEVSFEADGERWILLFDFAAIARFEQLADASMFDVLGRMEEDRLAGRAPRISHLGWLMQAGLSRHHPEASAEQALGLAMREEVQAQLGLAVSAAMPAPEGVSAEGNAKAGAKKATTGTKPSRSRSKRD